MENNSEITTTPLEEDPETPAVTAEEVYIPPEQELIQGWGSAAKISGWSENHLRNMVAAGEVAGYKDDATGYWTFKRSDLEALRDRPKKGPFGKLPAPASAPANAPVAAAPMAPQMGVVQPRPAPPPRLAPQAPPPPAKKTLQAIVGEPQRAKVYKRNEITGKREYVNAYSYKDVARSGDMESFIMAYLFPVWGAGEYEVELVDGDRILRSIDVPVRGPRPMGPGMPPVPLQEAGPSNADALGRMLEFIERREARPQPGLTDKLLELKQLKEMFAGGGGDPMLLFMLMQNQSKGPDPELMALRQDLRAIQDRLSQPPPPPAFIPPPMPPPEPAVNVTEVVKQVGELLRPSQQQPSFVELFTLMNQKKDGFTIEKLLGLLPTIMQLMDKFSGKDHLEALLGEIADWRKEQAKGGFRDIIENIKALREVASNDPFRPSGTETFLGVLKDLFTDWDKKIERVGDTITKVKSSKGGGGDGEPRGRLTAGKRSQRQAPVEASSDALASVVVPTQLPAATKKMAAAKNDTERVNATLAAFQILTKSPTWAWAAQKVVGHAKAGEKDELMKLLAEFVEGLQNPALGGAITDEVKGNIVKAFEKNIDKVIKLLAKE